VLVKIVQNPPKAHLTRLGGFVIYCALSATGYPAIKLQLSSSNIKKLLFFKAFLAKIILQKALL